MVERLAKRSWLDSLPRDLPNDKFIFVDTVISGRAICEIFQAFEGAGLEQCHFLLVVDHNGVKVTPQFRRVIDAMERAQRCTLIYVKRLFTEDRGPAVSGVWSTVYPQVLNAVRGSFAWAAEAYGAGSFYHRVSSSQVGPEKGVGDVEYNMPVTRMYASLSVGIFSALHAMMESDRAQADIAKVLPDGFPDSEGLVRQRRADIDARMKRSLDYHLREMRKTIDAFGDLTPLDKRTTRLLAEPRVLAEHPNASVEVSSSHLVRVTLPQKEIESFMREAERDLSTRRDVLADDWFR